MIDKSLLELSRDAQSELLETWTELNYGVIPLLEDLQGKHPEFEEESVFRALENLRERRDEIGMIETHLRACFDTEKESQPVPMTPDFLIKQAIQSAISIQESESNANPLSGLKFIASVLKIDLEKQ